MEKAHQQDNECCPRFNPEGWEGRELKWKDKLFVKGTLPQFMHMPLPGSFGKTVQKLWVKIEAAHARPDDKDFLMLAAEESAWKGEIYIATTREVPDADNVWLSGSFLTRVFDGSFNEVPKWIGQMEQYLTEQGKKAKDYFFYYTTCPRCAKKYGHNYVVVFARVENH